MLQSNVIHLTQQALWYVLLLSAPPILVAAVAQQAGWSRGRGG